MRKRITLLVAALMMALTMSFGSVAAFAVGGPNEAGNSGKFHPKSNPCQGQNDHPKCPGRH